MPKPNSNARKPPNLICQFNILSLLGTGLYLCCSIFLLCRVILKKVEKFYMNDVPSNESYQPLCQYGMCITCISRQVHLGWTYRNFPILTYDSLLLQCMGRHGQVWEGMGLTSLYDHHRQKACRTPGCHLFIGLYTSRTVCKLSY